MMKRHRTSCFDPKRTAALEKKIHTQFDPMCSGIYKLKRSSFDSVGFNQRLHIREIKRMIYCYWSTPLLTPLLCVELNFSVIVTWHHHLQHWKLKTQTQSQFSFLPQQIQELRFPYFVLLISQELCNQSGIVLPIKNSNSGDLWLLLFLWFEST